MRDVRSWECVTPGRRVFIQSLAPDPATITFRFKTPFVDFPYAAALPATAPVPLNIVAGSGYDTRIVSSGPYQIGKYERDSSLVLTRNPYWVETSDQARRAFPDKVVTTFGINPTAISARLISDQGQDQQAVSLSPVPPQDASDVADGAAKRSHDGYDNGVRFLVFSTTNPVLADVRVRQALEWAFPHLDARSSEGGAFVGDIATGVISPALGAFVSQDLYKTPEQRGDPAMTRQLLAEAGIHDLALTYAVPNTPTALATAAVVASAYRLAGVTLKIVPDNGTPSDADLVEVAEQPPWPAASAVVPGLFPCLTCDPALQVLLQQALSETDLEKADQRYASVDKMVMQEALVIPLYFTTTLSVHGSKVGNTTPASGFDGLVDLANLAVR